MNKIELLQDYIDKCNNYETLGIEPVGLIVTILSVFGDEIKNQYEGLEIMRYQDPRCSTRPTEEELKPICIHDIELLKAKLENHKCNIELEQSKTQQALVNVNNTVSINISFDQTISAINELPKNILSEEEKEILQGKMAQLQTLSNNKQKFWEKAQGIIKWIADKGVEVGIAALPHIVNCLKK